MRKCTSDDRDYIIRLAKQRYSKFLADDFDEGAVISWIDSCLNGDKDTAIFVRNDHAVCVFEFYRLFYSPKTLRINIRFLAAERMPGNPGLRLLKSVIEQAKVKGVSDVIFGEETGAKFDILARKIGAQPFERCYVLRL